MNLKIGFLRSRAKDVRAAAPRHERRYIPWRMTYTPSTRDLETLRRALEALASPLRYHDPLAWSLEARRWTRRLLGGDQAHLMLDGRTFHTDIEPETLAAYESYYGRLDVAPRIARRRGLEVSSYEELFGWEALQASEYYQDFLRPNRLHRIHGLGFFHASGGKPSYSFLTTSVRDRGRKEIEERAPALLPLLLPAFKAGVRTLLMAAAHERNVVDLVDRMEVGIALCDATGRPCHLNPALRGLLTRVPGASTLLREIGAAARRLERLRGERPGRWSPSGDIGESRVVTGAGEYRLTATRVGREAPGPGEVLVRVDPLFRTTLADAELEETFGLTARERQVARLLARGLPNREVADALGISPHTARRHTERILRKLGIRSRAQVEERISRG